MNAFPIQLKYTSHGLILSNAVFKIVANEHRESHILEKYSLPEGYTPLEFCRTTDDAVQEDISPYWILGTYESPFS